VAAPVPAPTANPGVRHLLDLSAWARSSHPTAADRWADLVNADVLIAHPVFALELLHTATTASNYGELRQALEDGFDWVQPDEETAMIALRMQARMASQAPTGQRVKTPDLLIAALAAQHGHAVLHYDADYDAIRERGGEPFESEWLAPRGSLDTGGASGTAAKKARRAYKKSFGERMIQFENGEDLVVWPELIDWLDEQLRARELQVPPPPATP
jgi:predicted nucleic acid-binding protein